MKIIQVLLVLKRMLVENIFSFSKVGICDLVFEVYSLKTNKAGTSMDIPKTLLGSILPVVPKIYERIIQKQRITFVNEYLSPYLCGYGKETVHTTH